MCGVIDCDMYFRIEGYKDTYTLLRNFEEKFVLKKKKILSKNYIYIF